MLVALSLPQSAYSKMIRLSDNIIYDGEIMKVNKQKVPHGQGVLMAYYSNPEGIQCTIKGIFDNGEVEDAVISVKAKVIERVFEREFTTKGKLSYSISGNELAFSMSDYDWQTIIEALKKDKLFNKDQTIEKMGDLSAKINGTNESAIIFTAITKETNKSKLFGDVPQAKINEVTILWPRSYDLHPQTGYDYASNPYDVESKIIGYEIDGVQAYHIITDGKYIHAYYNDNDYFTSWGGLFKINEDTYAITDDSYYSFCLCKNLPDEVISVIKDCIKESKDIPRESIAPYCYYHGELINTITEDSITSKINRISSPSKNADVFEHVLLGWTDVQGVFFDNLKKEFPPIKQELIMIPYEKRSNSVMMGIPEFRKYGDRDATYMEWAGGKPLLIFGRTVDELVSPLRMAYNEYVERVEANDKAKQAEKAAYFKKHGYDAIYEDVAKKHGSDWVKKYFSSSDYVIIGFPMQCMLDIIKTHNRNNSFINQWYNPDFESEWTDAGGSWEVFTSYDGVYDYRIWVKDGKIHDYIKTKSDRRL